MTKTIWNRKTKKPAPLYSATSGLRESCKNKTADTCTQKRNSGLNTDKPCHSFFPFLNTPRSSVIKQDAQHIHIIQSNEKTCKSFESFQKTFKNRSIIEILYSNVLAFSCVFVSFSRTLCFACEALEPRFTLKDMNTCNKF